MYNFIFLFYFIFNYILKLKKENYIRSLIKEQIVNHSHFSLSKYHY